MRYRALGSFAIALTISAIAVAPASGWTQLAPITPAPAIPIVYTKGLALEFGGGGVASGIWVTDVGNGPPNDRVYKYSLSPTSLLQTIGGAAGTSDDLNYPGGVAVNPANHDVYISDTSTGRILQFSSAGTFIRANGPASGTIALDRPHGLKVVGNTLYIANSGTNGANRGVKRVSLDLQTWGGDMPSSDFHTGPSDVAVDPIGGRIWAADEGYRHGESDPGVDQNTLGSVLRFNTSGTQVQRITNASFGQPYSVEYDAAANVLYMDDYYMNTIYALDADTGQILDSIGSAIAPVAMSFDPNTRILYAGQVGTHTYQGAGVREIERYQIPAAPNCTGQPNTTTPINTNLGITLNCGTGSDTITYEITSSPTKGHFTGAPGASGALTYVPNNNTNGTDHFSFRVVSKRGITKPENVDIVITGTPPVDPPDPTGPTGPTAPPVTPPVVPPTTTEPDPVVQQVSFPPAHLTSKPSVQKVNFSTKGMKLKIKGTFKLAGATGDVLPVTACSDKAKLALQYKKGSRYKTLNSESVKLASLGGACTAKFSLTTAASNSNKKLSIKITHPGNDSILPIDARLKVASTHN